MQKPRHFIFGFLVSLGLALGMAALLNITVDPAGLFGTGREEAEAASVLLAGKTYAVQRQINDRQMVRAVINGLNEAPETLIIGSSRMAVFEQHMLATKSLYNVNLIEARLEDIYGVINAFERRNILPRRVIIGVDAWIFNAANRSILWQPLQQDYSDLRQRLGATCMPASAEAGTNKVVAALSLGYLTDSVKAIANRSGDSQSKEQGLRAIRPDGSIRYPGTAIDHLTVQGVAASIAIKPPQPIANFTRLDPCYQTAFRQLLAHLRNAGVDVTLYLPPYHPVSYAVIQATPMLAAIPATEVLVQRLADEFGLKRVGSYDPATSPCSADEFLDWHHFTAGCAAKELSRAATR